MSNALPKYLINKRKYNSERYKNNGYKGFSVNLPIDKFNEINEFLKEKDITREEFIKRIIEKYK